MLLRRRKFKVNIEGLRNALNVPIIEVSAKKESASSLKSKFLAEHSKKGEPIIDSKKIGGKTLGVLAEKYPNENQYRLFKSLNNLESLTWLADKDFYELVVQNSSYNRNEAELHEINNRYEKIQEIIAANVTTEIQNDEMMTLRLELIK